jgi:hypothetical protein
LGETVTVTPLLRRYGTMPSSSDHQRLAGKPTSWPSWPRGTACRVYMGHGWASGVWDGLQGRSGAVWVGKDQRMVYVGDARNVRAA